VEEAGAPHIVLLSSVGAQHAHGTGPIKALHYAEDTLRATGAVVTVLRPAYFMENWGNVAAVAVAQGVLPSFFDRATHYPMIATRDIGRAVARALLDPPAASRVIELAGPRDPSPEEVAAAFSRALEKPIQLADVPEPGHRAALARNLPAPFADLFADLFAEMYAGILHGRVAFEGKPVRGDTELDEVVKGLVTH
jgi:uncharacterized protein YbjT (DUF2867 family)